MAAAAGAQALTDGTPGMTPEPGGGPATAGRGHARCQLTVARPSEAVGPSAVPVNRLGGLVRGFAWEEGRPGTPRPTTHEGAHDMPNTIRCTVCSQPLAPLHLLDGYTTHPTCDAQWQARLRVMKVGGTTWETVPCCQAHEAAVLLGDLETCDGCVACYTKQHQPQAVA